MLWLALAGPRVLKGPLKGTSLAVHWLRLGASSAQGVVGSSPSQGTKILHATWCGQKIKSVPREVAR